MKKNRFNTYWTFLAVIILLSIFNSGRYNNTVNFAGITSTLNEIKNLISGISAFVNSIASISKLVGFSTFLLFLFILILSSGLSAIGLPRGKSSFLISLVIADSLWILWEESFNPESLFYLKKIIKSNLFILSPVILFAFIRSIYPRLMNMLKKSLKLKIKGKSGKLSESKSIEISENFAVQSQNFQRFLMKDIVESSDKKTITLSQDTIAGAKKLKELLSIIAPR